MLLRSQSRRRPRRAQATLGLGCQMDDPSALLLPLCTEVRGETVWKILGGRNADVRFAPWRARNTPRTYPTTNGITSSLIFLRPQGEDAPRFTVHGRSLTRSSTCSRAAAHGGYCRRTSRLGKASTTGSG